MRAEIISIGTEILIGAITNTNARYLAGKLAENAIDSYYQVTVGDNVGRLVETLETAAARTDIIITSGGLGPTEDDITLEALLRFLQKPAVLHQPTLRYIQKRLRLAGYKMSKLALRQCYVPKGSIVFQNFNGAAPGILSHIQRAGKKIWVLVLPGPPRELEPMFNTQALPALLSQAKIKREHFVVRSLKIAGFTETQVAERVPAFLKSKPPLTVGIYARPDLVTLKVMAKAGSQKKARQMADRTEKQIRKKLGSSIFGIDDETLSSAVGKILANRKKTLAVAESCSGGLLGSLITDTPGSSAYFLGGIIAYHNKVKTAELAVPAILLKKHGAVSEPVAEAMVQECRKRFASDYGISITGIAGPDGGTLTKPVGLVCMAIASDTGIFVKKMILRGNRHEIKTRAAHRALNALRLQLLQKAL